ncbi:MAG: right-handed parallel beta-helix repeat-containing protein [Nitrososphaerota archaeon]|jgi:parallel beta-helix repeat protein|nr:right-handed parallel beta-helix repeat-containing protein [Candidatus Termiticorpusculum sp.]MDR0461151.1 right-handed parallel beta-helix repeat-containing protein [Nitrososphaerota archaeon]
MSKTAVALFVLLLLSVLFIVCVEPVRAQRSGVIRIKADGTVTGTDKIVSQDGLVYTMVGDLYSSVGQNEAFIFVEKSGVTFDGAGHSIQGTGVGSAIYVLRSQGVTVENFVIRGFSIGIDFGIVENWPSDVNYLSQSSAFGNKIRNNKIEGSTNIVKSNQTRGAGWCVYLNDASQTLIMDNEFICHNSLGAVYFGNSTSETSLIYNNFAGGGVYSLSSNQTVASGNTIDGASLVYLDGKSDRVIEEAGLVYLFNCRNIVVKNVNPAFVYNVTIQLVDTVNCEISNSNGYMFLIKSNYNNIHDNTLKSIVLDASSHNNIFSNKITDSIFCIKMYRASNFNNVYGNLLTDTTQLAVTESTRNDEGNTIALQLGDIQLGGVFNNDIRDNMIVNHECGFEFFLSSNNTITANTIKDCTVGIRVGKSHYNTLTENNITLCKYGVSIYAESSYNTFYYNNFIENQLQCIEIHQQTILSNGETYAIGNTWDNGQTGNYWDTYTNTDTNGDGIGDTPYKIFESMTDNYPLIKPFTSTNTNYPTPTYDPAPPITSGNSKQKLSTETTIIIIAIIITLGAISGLLVYFRRLIFREYKN